MALWCLRVCVCVSAFACVRLSALVVAAGNVQRERERERERSRDTRQTQDIFGGRERRERETRSPSGRRLKEEMRVK